MSNHTNKWGGEEQLGSDRRTFLKHLGVVVPLGYSLSVTNATACTPDEFADTSLAQEVAWRMVGHDPAHTGFNRDATGPEPPVEMQWRVSGLPGGVSPPVVVGDTAYVGTGAGDPGRGDLRAISADRGATRWLFVPSKPGVGVPAVVPGTIYISGADDNVNAVDVNSKSSRWTFDAKGPTGFPKATGDTVYIPATRSFPLPIPFSNVYAIHAESGEEQWRFDRLSGPIGTVAVSNGMVYVGAWIADTTLYALDAATGAEQWRFETASGSTNVPAVAHETVYAGSADGNVYALNAGTGEEQWRFEDATTPFGIPAVDDETVYVPNSDESLYAIDATTGEQRWRADAPSDLIRPPTVGVDTVYVGSTDTNVYALDATTGAEQWRFERATEPMGSPVPVGDALYVGTDGGTLYALT